MLSYPAFHIKSGAPFFLKRTAMQGQVLLNKLQGTEKNEPFSARAGSVYEKG